MLTGFFSAYSAEGLLKTMGRIVHTIEGADGYSSCFLGGMQLYNLGLFKSINLKI